MNNATRTETTLTAVETFDGDFSFLPFAAGVRYGQVPLYPTSEDFQRFACTKAHEERPEAYWQLEAIRWRRQNAAHPLDIKAIAVATAAAIYRAVRP